MKTEPLKILFVDDNPLDVELAVYELETAGINLEPKRVDTIEGFTAELMQGPPDIIISEYLMAGFNGLQILEIAKNTGLNLPFIMFTGSLSEIPTVECLKAGAWDYVMKENISRLPLTVLEVLKQKQIIIEKNLAENALREREEKYRNIFENIQSVYYETSIDGAILEISPSIVELSHGQYHREDLLGTSMLNYYQDPGERDRLLQILKEKGQIQSYEISLKNRDGSLIDCLLTAKLHLDDKQQPKKIIGTLGDNSVQKRIEKELILAKDKAEESDHLKTSFLNNLSHEVRTPLNGILGFVDLLNDPDLTAEEIKRFTGIINKNAAQLLHIIHDIVDISLIETGQEQVQTTVFNLNDLLDGVSSSLQLQVEQKKLIFSLRKNLSNEEALIKCDQSKLSRILTHLTENAIKFTEHGSVSVDCSRSGPDLIFRITDTGIGIEPGIRQTIFERFRQAELAGARKYGGTGLGLSIAKAYVELLGGTISVESNPGQGSSFTFRIPYKPGAQRKTGLLETVSRIGKGQKGTILIAEDEAENAFYLEIILKSAGFNIRWAKDGVEAVNQCRKHADVSLVLMDLKMPKMDGIEATKEIKSFRKKLPVIATTAFALSDDEKRCREAGCIDYLSKPIDKLKLMDAISRWV